MPKKAVTIRDVARQAGVSVATASRALNGKNIVNPQTRDRILTVVEELGFRPSPAARRLSLGRTLTIGVVVSFLTRPQAAERLRGVDAIPPLTAAQSKSRESPASCSLYARGGGVFRAKDLAPPKTWTARWSRLFDAEVSIHTDAES